MYPVVRTQTLPRKKRCTEYDTKLSTQFKCQNSSISSYSVQQKYKFSSIWLIDSTLSGVTTLGQNEPGSDGNNKVLSIRQRFQYYWSSTVRLFNVISRTVITEILPFCRGTVGVFYNPCWLGQPHFCGVLPLSRDAIGVFYSPSRLGRIHWILKVWYCN